MARRIHRSAPRRERQWLTLTADSNSSVLAGGNFALSVMSDSTQSDSGVASWLASTGAGATIYALRRFTIAAVHCYFNFAYESPNIVVGAIGLGIQGASQTAQTSDLPVVLSNNTPRAFPAVFPLKLSGIGQYKDGTVTAGYTSVGLSKGQRVVQLGQAVYGSFNAWDSAGGQPSLALRKEQPYFRVLCLL